MTGNHQVQPHLGALWTLLQGTKIEGEGAERRFEEALAAEQGWSLEFAERVTREYRRFLYLAASSAGEITPSRAVDAAWHLHLTYSRHYWDELCARILGRPLHHNPSTGAAADEERFARQYEDTLALYRRTFGQTPPADIWPPLPAPDQPAEAAEEEHHGGVGPIGALLCAPFMIVFGAISADTTGALVGAFCAAMTILAFILFGPKTPPAPARTSSAQGGGGSCGTTLVLHDRAVSSDASCGGGCGGD